MQPLSIRWISRFRISLRFTILRLELKVSLKRLMGCSIGAIERAPAIFKRLNIYVSVKYLNIYFSLKMTRIDEYKKYFALLYRFMDKKMEVFLK